MSCFGALLDLPLNYFNFTVNDLLPVVEFTTKLILELIKQEKFAQGQVNEI